MIDKFTFAIVLIKLFGIQVILAGIVIAYVDGRNFYAMLIAFGSLIFAIASNCLLAHFLREKNKILKGEYKNGKTHNHKRGTDQSRT